MAVVGKQDNVHQFLQEEIVSYFWRVTNAVGSIPKHLQPHVSTVESLESSYFLQHAVSM
jgi:hypothetical protein